MSDGASIYSMITGIGDGFSSAYDGARKRRQEEEAPTLISNLVSAYQGGQSGAPGTLPSAAPSADASIAAPSDGPVRSPLPSFARAQGAMPSEKLRGLIADVSTRNDIDPSYLPTLVQIESNGNPNAYNKGSGASGLGQFIPRTAQAYGLTDPFDPVANLNATARLTLDNRETLRGRLGRDPTNGELYLGHQQGASGAARLLANPDLPAARLVGMKAVLANGGTADMTAREFASKWTSRFDGAPAPPATPVAAPIAVANNEAEAQALDQRMGTAPPASAPAVASAEPEAADKPVAGAVPTSFVIPGQAQAPAPAQGFPGFGSTTSRMTPAQSAALTAAWRNPETRPMATAIYGQILKGSDSAWSLSTMGDQPVLFNAKTAQVVPIGQAKRQTATVGNVIVDTATGQPIYQAEKDDKFTYQSMPGVGMVALHPTDPDRSRIIIAGQQPRPLSPDERAAYQVPNGTGAGMGADGKPFTLGGGSKTEVNVDTKGQGKFAEKANEFMAKRYGEMVDAADQAVPLRADIDTMAQIGSQISTGKLADARLSLAQYAKAAGLDPIANSLTNGKMGEMEAFTALADKLTPRMRVPGSGSTSDADSRSFKNSLPSLLKTPEGNAIIVNTFRGLADYQAQVGDIAGRALRGEVSQSEADQAIKAIPSPYSRFKEYQSAQNGASSKGDAGAGSGVAKGSDRITLPDGTSAAQAVFEARKAVAAGRDRAEIEKRLRSYGIDPKRLDQ